MFRKLGKLILSIVFLISFIGLPNQTNAEDTESRFICLSMFDKSDILLSWESVPFTSSYRVYKNNEEIEKVGGNSNFFLDTEIDNNSDYVYKVESYDANGNLISKSFDIPVSISYKEDLRIISLEFTLGSNMYRVDGVEKGPMPTPPIVNSGRSYLVIRYITDELGAQISWDSGERKVTINSVTGDVIELWIGNPVAKINGINTKIDENDDSVVPYISEGRTLLPVRFVSDSLGADEVLWDEEEKKITLVWTEPEAPQSKITLSYHTQYNDKRIFLDSLGNQYTLNGFQKKSSKSIGIISFPYNIVSYDSSSNTSTLKMSNYEKTESSIIKFGNVIENNFYKTDGFIKIRVSELEIIKCYYDNLDNNIRHIPIGAWIYFSSDEKKNIQNWEYCRNEIHDGCTDGQLTFRYINTILENNTISIEEENIVDNNTTTYLLMGDYAPNMFEENICYDVKYKTNWLGRKITDSVKENPCCLLGYQISEIENSKGTIYGEGIRNYEFNIESHSIGINEIETFVRVEGENRFPGKIEFEKKLHSLNQGEVANEVFTIKTNCKSEGTFIISYGIKCGDTEISKEFELSIVPCDKFYKIIFPEKIYLPDNSPKLEFMCTIENYSDIEIELKLSARKIKFFYVETSIENLTVEKKSKANFKVKIINLYQKNSYNNDINCGDSFQLFIDSQDQFGQRNFETEFTIEEAIRPFVYLESKSDYETNEVSLEINVDWATLKENSYKIEWGDGTIDTIETLTTKHLYQDEGIYEIKVTASSAPSSSSNPITHGYSYLTVKTEDGLKTPELENIKLNILVDPLKAQITFDPITDAEILEKCEFTVSNPRNIFGPDSFSKSCLSDGKISLDLDKKVKYQNNEFVVVFIKYRITDEKYDKDTNYYNFKILLDSLQND
ncbi:MAG: stalk domain-containing protein [Caldisericia bacterium]